MQETCFYHLEAPVVRVAGWDTPYPHAQEWDYFPGPARVGRALLESHGGVTWREHVIKLPDVGEGVAEAELVEWHVKVGDLVREDTILAAVMTDKATVEIPSPVDGEIVWLGAEVGDMVAVGSDLVRLKVAGERDAASAAQPQPRPRPPKRRAGTCGEAPRGRQRGPRHGRCHVPERAAASGTAAEPRPATAGSGARRARQAARVAGRAPARARGRHRPASGHRAPGRPAASPTKISTPSLARGPRAVRAPALAADDRGRGHQGRRAAARIAEQMALAQCAHPAYHLRRGGRRHGAGGAAGRR